jgi:hypothetical protein
MDGTQNLFITMSDEISIRRFTWLLDQRIHDQYRDGRVRVGRLGAQPQGLRYWRQANYISAVAVNIPTRRFDTFDGTVDDFTATHQMRVYVIHNPDATHRLPLWRRPWHR